jgi:glycosyltransferase involved in cell wall biosynthesis
MEDFGIVPFEALSMKKPLIVTNKGGYMRVIKDLPQVIQIEEKGDREEMVDEIYKCLKQFLDLKIRFKKVNFNYLDEENFRKKLFDILEDKK